MFLSFPSLGRESCLGHLGLPGKGVALLETGTHDLGSQSEAPPTTLHMSGVSPVGAEGQEPHLCLLCMHAKLSTAPQVPSELGTAIWSLGQWTEISSLDFLFLRNKKRLPTHSALQSPGAHSNSPPADKGSPLPQRVGEVRAGGQDSPHASGPSWTRYLGSNLSLFILSGLISHWLVIHTSCLGSKAQSHRSL